MFLPTAEEEEELEEDRRPALGPRRALIVANLSLIPRNSSILRHRRT